MRDTPWINSAALQGAMAIRLLVLVKEPKQFSLSVFTTPQRHSNKACAICWGSHNNLVKLWCANCEAMQQRHVIVIQMILLHEHQLEQEAATSQIHLRSQWLRVI